VSVRAQLPPGPRAPRAIQTLGWWSRPISFHEGCRARYGKRFTIRLLVNYPLVMLSDPDEIREVFTAPPDVLHAGEGPSAVLGPVLGRHSVILLDEGAHLEQRKLMLPAFHGEKMQALAGVMAEVAEREAAAWPRDRPVRLHPRLQGLTLEIILRAVFGLEAGERLDALRQRLTGILDVGTNPTSMLPPLRREWGGIGPWARFVKLREEADRLIFELVDERRRDDHDGDDVLSMLLAARHEDGSPMSNEELRDELMTLLVAGHETTASELAWAFERLAREPRVLGRLVDEVDGGDEDAYLTATVHETLRRRPVLPNAGPRLIKQPVEIGGWSYPTGACLTPNAYLVHHDPAIYPEPYAFRPERFLDEQPGTYTWIPFGGGRRRCLGASFALLEMKIVLAAVLRQCELHPASEGMEVARRRAITLSPRAGARAVLRERARVPAAVA
jgi:cytochrome P450